MASAASSLLLRQHLLDHRLQDIDLVQTRLHKQRDKLGGLLIAEVVEPLPEALDERVVGLGVFPLLADEHLEQVEELGAPELQVLDLGGQVVGGVEKQLVVDCAVQLLASGVVFEGDCVEQAVGQQVGGDDLVKDRVEGFFQQPAVVRRHLPWHTRHLHKLLDLVIAGLKRSLIWCLQGNQSLLKAVIQVFNRQFAFKLSPIGALLVQIVHFGRVHETNSLVPVADHAQHIEIFALEQRVEVLLGVHGQLLRTKGVHCEEIRLD